MSEKQSSTYISNLSSPNNQCKAKIKWRISDCAKKLPGNMFIVHGHWNLVVLVEHSYTPFLLNQSHKHALALAVASWLRISVSLRHLKNDTGHAKRILNGNVECAFDSLWNLTSRLAEAHNEFRSRAWNSLKPNRIANQLECLVAHNVTMNDNAIVDNYISDIKSTLFDTTSNVDNETAARARLQLSWLKSAYLQNTRDLTFFNATTFLRILR